MKIQMFQVDAFTDTLFRGNPAAVCPMQDWPEPDVMQKIAAENNLAETAFFITKGSHFELRWFTPEVEVDLCGHATLASGHVLFNHLNYPGNEILFQSKSGPLKVTGKEDFITLDFPASKCITTGKMENLADALGSFPVEVCKARDYLALFSDEKSILRIQPDFEKLKKLDCLGIIVTAPGERSDFVSRFFAPAVGVNEDPVTGSAHTMLIPFWAEKLKKNKLHAFQLSKRGGELFCELAGDRVLISGKAVTYLVGEIAI